MTPRIELPDDPDLRDKCERCGSFIPFKQSQYNDEWQVVCAACLDDKQQFLITNAICNKLM